jgi:hypothetical protein
MVYPYDLKMILIVFHLESLVRTLIATRTKRRNTLIKHDTVIAILATSDSSCAWERSFAMTHHRTSFCPALAFNENI